MTTQLPGSFEGAPNDDFEPIPAGQYRADITNYSVKATRDRTGSYAEIELNVSGGEFDGRRLWARHTLTNGGPKGAQAMAIGKRQMQELAFAALGEGHSLVDLAQLAAKTVLVEVVVKPAQGQYSASNEVKRYYPLTQQAAAAAQTSHELPADNSPPW